MPCGETTEKIWETNDHHHHITNIHLLQANQINSPPLVFSLGCCWVLLSSHEDQFQTVERAWRRQDVGAVVDCPGEELVQGLEAEPDWCGAHVGN